MSFLRLKCLFHFFNSLFFTLRRHTLLYDVKPYFDLFYVDFTLFYWKLFIFDVVKASFFSDIR